MNVSKQSFQATEKSRVLQWAMTVSVIANRLVLERKTKNKHKLVPKKNPKSLQSNDQLKRFLEAEIVLEHYLPN